VQRFFFGSRRDCHPVNGSAQDLALQNSVLMTRFYQPAPPNPIYITRSERWFFAREAELATEGDWPLPEAETGQVQPDWPVFLQHCDRRRSSAHCVLCSTVNHS